MPGGLSFAGHFSFLCFASSLSLSMFSVQLSYDIVPDAGETGDGGGNYLNPLIRELAAIES